MPSNSVEIERVDDAFKVSTVLSSGTSFRTLPRIRIGDIWSMLSNVPGRFDGYSLRPPRSPRFRAFPHDRPPPMPNMFSHDPPPMTNIERNKLLDVLEKKFVENTPAGGRKLWLNQAYDSPVSLSPVDLRTALYIPENVTKSGAIRALYTPEEMASWVVNSKKTTSPSTRLPFKKLRRLPPYLAEPVQELGNRLSRLTL